MTNRSHITLVNNTGTDLRFCGVDEAIIEADGGPLPEAIADLFTVEAIDYGPADRRLIVRWKEDEDEAAMTFDEAFAISKSPQAHTEEQCLEAVRILSNEAERKKRARDRALAADIEKRARNLLIDTVDRQCGGRPT